MTGRSVMTVFSLCIILDLAVVAHSESSPSMILSSRESGDELSRLSYTTRRDARLQRSQVVILALHFARELVEQR